MPLTTPQTDIIKATVPVVRKHGKEITSVFYANLLTDVPSLNNVFNTANQVNGHQAGALAGALYAYASNIDSLGHLKPAIERITQKHASLHIQPDQYDVVGTYLLRAMGEVLEDAFTSEIKDAWTAAYTQLADVMIEREAQLYKSAEGWVGWKEFVISEKVVEAEHIDSFYLKPKDGKPLPPFKPGQYISVQTPVPELHYLQSRQYSLSSPPRSDFYRISVKKEGGLATDHPEAPAHPGYVSTILHEKTKVGDVLQVAHPYGDFFLDTDKPLEHPLVLISAGVGITPMISILDTLVAKRSLNPISWIHATRNSRLQAFGQHVREVAKTHDNIQLHIFNKNPQETDMEGVDYHFAGRVDLGKLDRERDLFVADEGTEYYVCGPEGFMEDVKAALVGYGVDADRVKLEVFGTASLPDM